MRIKYIIFFLFYFACGIVFSQVTTFLWSGYVRATHTPVGVQDYFFNLTCAAPVRTASVEVNITSTGSGAFTYNAGANLGGALMPVYNNNVDPMNSGATCAPNGLLMGVDWADLTSFITVKINFNVNVNGVSGPVQFSLFDLNNQYDGCCGASFFDVVDISANKPGPVAITPILTAPIPANNSIGGGGCAFGWASSDCSLSSSTAANTLTFKGSNSGCTDWSNNFITIGTGADIIESVTLKYYTKTTGADNGNTQANPVKQKIIISNISTGGICISVLPVELTAFTGKCNGTKKTLSWATASENNNKNFIVEHSKDGLGFEEIGIVNGHGNSDRAINYEYAFTEEASDYLYYRLKQTDLNGVSKTLKTIYLNCIDKIGSLNLFPNPATNQIKLEFESSEETEFIISIKDIVGRVVKSITRVATQGENESLIQVEDLPAGVYQVVIGDNDGLTRSKTLKFIKSSE